MAELELRRVRKVYPGGIVGVEDVSLAVEAGECFVLLGPSGSGKSTLLRLVAGLEDATSGSILIRGDAVDRIPPHERGVSYLGQRPVLYPDRRVRENLSFGIAVEKPALDEIAALLAIADLLDRRPGELSGGQLQRVALGRALLRDAPILLLDEPLTSLDGPLRWDLRRILHLLQSRRRATMIYVTHDQEEALSLADRLAVFENGRLVQVGTPSEVLSRPATAFVARHLGWPPMTLHHGRLDADPMSLSLAGTVDPRSIPPSWEAFAGRDVLLGWRSSGDRDLGQALLFDALTGCLLSPSEADTRPGNQPPAG
jgi:multiple sugar transport system ATP-binding protein